ncbi:aminopeptidase P family protein [Candidatus Woesearchaeota archaeon]|nr:aminopeptidase P family protein [Candidatus Woesearchaeota archaeon]
MRVKGIKEVLVKQGIDALIIFSDDPYFFYLVGKTIDDGYVIVTRKGKPAVFVSPLEQFTSKVFSVIKLKEVAFAKFIADRKISVIGVNESLVLYSRIKGIRKHCRIKSVENELEGVFAAKSRAEIKHLSRACTLTDSIFKSILKEFNFKVERELVDFIKIQTIKHGCTPSFDPIVASGAGSAIPHYSGNRKIGRGFLIVDFGVKFKGLCSDVTRTFFVGKPSVKEKEMYNLVLSAQVEAIKALKDGVIAKDIDGIARKALSSQGKHFIHSTGHGLGGVVHEAPNIGPKSNQKLISGMVVTIEPGLYFPGKFGVRIEDDILITGSGTRVLSRFPKGLLCLG